MLTRPQQRVLSQAHGCIQGGQHGFRGALEKPSCSQAHSHHHWGREVRSGCPLLQPFRTLMPKIQAMWDRCTHRSQPGRAGPQRTGRGGPQRALHPAQRPRAPRCGPVWPAPRKSGSPRSASPCPQRGCAGRDGEGGEGMVTSQNAQHSQNSPHRCWQGGEGDPDRWEDDCGTYWVSSGMASTALPYTLQEPCCWSSAAFPPLWSLQVSSSVHPQYGGHPISATLGDEGAHSPSTPSCPTPTDTGFALGSPPRRASPTPPITVQLSSTPLPVFVCTEYSLQHHPLLFDGSLAGQKCRCMCMGGEHSSASSPPAPCALWVKD